MKWGHLGLKIAVLMLAVAALLAGLWAYRQQQQRLNQPKPLSAMVTVGDLEHTVMASGTLQARKLVNVGAQASGQLQRLLVSLGDRVQKGQLVAELDPLTQQNTLQSRQQALINVQAQRSARQAELEQARLNYTREKAMLVQDATSRMSYEAAQAAFATAQASLAAINAQIRQAQLEVSTAQLNLGYTRVLAPMSGTVVAVVTEEGQTINANQSIPTIIKLADLSTLTIKAQISEADVDKVRPGQTVYFTTLGNPDRKYYATLRAIEPAPESIASESGQGTSANSNAVYYNGLFDVPNPDGSLRIDMTAQVYIVLDKAKNALIIPAAALSKAGATGRQTISVLDAQGQPQPRQVTIGLNNRVSAQVLSGLHAGERVVIGELSPKASSDKTPSASGRRNGPPLM